MKELTKKILESGLVDKHVALMLERWGTLEQGSSDMVGKKQVAKEGLERFADEIEELLDKDQGEVHETRLEVPIMSLGRLILECGGKGRTIIAAEDEMGRLIIDPRTDFLHPGAKVQLGDTGAIKQVLEIEELYQGDRLVAYQVTVG